MQLKDDKNMSFKRIKSMFLLFWYFSAPLNDAFDVGIDRHLYLLST